MAIKRPRNLKEQSSNGSDVGDATEKLRRVTGKTRNVRGTSLKAKGKIDPWDPSLSISDVFGDVSGAQLIEMIFSTYGDPKEDYMNVPWFSDDGTSRPNLIADPLNRPLQLSTVADYKNRIFQSGLAEDCSGDRVAGFPWLWGCGAVGWATIFAGDFCYSQETFSRMQQLIVSMQSLGG